MLVLIGNDPELGNIIKAVIAGQVSRVEVIMVINDGQLFCRFVVKLLGNGVLEQKIGMYKGLEHGKCVNLTIASVALNTCRPGRKKKIQPKANEQTCTASTHRKLSAVFSDRRKAHKKEKYSHRG